MGRTSKRPIGGGQVSARSPPLGPLMNDSNDAAPRSGGSSVPFLGHSCIDLNGLKSWLPLPPLPRNHRTLRNALQLLHPIGLLSIAVVTRATAKATAANRCRTGIAYECSGMGKGPLPCHATPCHVDALRLASCLHSRPVALRFVRMQSTRLYEGQLRLRRRAREGLEIIVFAKPAVRAIIIIIIIIIVISS